MKEILEELTIEMENMGLMLKALDLASADCHRGIKNNIDLIK
jgi:hypothetical protein